MVAYDVVGQTVRRVEGPEKVTGRAQYGIDILLPGTLWCKVLRSPYPHARIVRVDTTRARQLPGVHAILTGEDVRGMRTGGTYKDEPVLAWDRVLFVGDKVAAVAAEDEDIAQRALDLIEVEYKEVRAVFDAEAAAREVRQRLQRLAAEFLGWSEEAMAFREGYLVNTGTRERVPLEAIAARAGGPVTASRTIEEPSSPYTSFAAHVAEVSVDPETGQVRLLRYTAAQDTGQVLNHLTFQGQVEGGIVYALGQTLMEELVVEEGRVTNPSFADFKVPTARDIPELRTVVLEAPQEGDGPYNVRGIGEHSNITVAPAVANAIADACGARVLELPITAEKVYRALRAGEGGGDRGAGSLNQ